MPTFTRPRRKIEVHVLPVDSVGTAGRRSVVTTANILSGDNAAAHRAALDAVSRIEGRLDTDSLRAHAVHDASRELRMASAWIVITDVRELTRWGGPARVRVASHTLIEPMHEIGSDRWHTLLDALRLELCARAATWAHTNP